MKVFGIICFVLILIYEIDSLKIRVEKLEKEFKSLRCDK
jgi:hypothetical protein